MPQDTEGRSAVKAVAADFCVGRAERHLQAENGEVSLYVPTCCRELCSSACGVKLAHAGQRGESGGTATYVAHVLFMAVITGSDSVKLFV